MSRRNAGTSSSSIESNVGTHESTVTPASDNIRERSGPACAISGVAATSLAPAWNASQTSSTDASKESENP